MKKLPGSLDNLNELSTNVGKSLGKVNPLLDKANAIDEAKVRSLTQDILLRSGMKVYMHPFGPADLPLPSQAPVPTAHP